LGRFPSRALGFGSEDEAAGILAEWMRWNAQGRWVGTDGFDYFAALAAVRTPYLAVAGGADRVFAPVAACRQVVEHVGSERKTLTVESGLSHRGLVLSPKARDSCWTGVAAWLKETLA
jgi:oxygen-independent coproporphyrinogen-3 oxidase